MRKSSGVISIKPVGVFNSIVYSYIKWAVPFSILRRVIRSFRPSLFISRLKTSTAARPAPNSSSGYCVDAPARPRPSSNAAPVVVIVRGLPAGRGAWVSVLGVSAPIVRPMRELSPPDQYIAQHEYNHYQQYQ